MNVSIKQMRAFLALDRHRNFTRAAAEVNLSQPAFSAVINGLEAELGFRLFDRDTHRVRPTEDGESFAAIASHVVNLYDASVREVAAIARGERGRVAIAALPSVAVSWLPDALRGFRAAHPQVRLELIDALSDRCLEALADGQADFALTAPGVLPGGMRSVKLCEEGFSFVCPADHPLADHKILSVAALEGETLLNFAGTTSIGQALASLLPGRLHADTLAVEQLTTMMGLVAAGIGGCLVPDLALYQFQHPRIRVVPLADCPVRREIHLIERTDRALSMAAEHLRAAILIRAGAAPDAGRGGFSD